MPSIQLYLHQEDPTAVFRFVRPNGTTDEIPRLRLVTYANLSAQLTPGPGVGRFRIMRSIIDTGSQLALIPEEIWRHFRPGVVTPLPFHPSTPLAGRRIIVAGGTFPFELGELTLRLEDKDRQYLNVTVVAQLTHDGGRLRVPMTIGLRGGVIDGRTLSAVPDVAAPFAQAWHLEEP